MMKPATCQLIFSPALALLCAASLLVGSAGTAEAAGDKGKEQQLAGSSGTVEPVDPDGLRTELDQLIADSKAKAGSIMSESEVSALFERVDRAVTQLGSVKTCWQSAHKRFIQPYVLSLRTIVAKDPALASGGKRDELLRRLEVILADSEARDKSGVECPNLFDHSTDLIEDPYMREPELLFDQLLAIERSTKADGGSSSPTRRDEVAQIADSITAKLFSIIEGCQIDQMNVANFLYVETSIRRLKEMLAKLKPPLANEQALVAKLDAIKAKTLVEKAKCQEAILKRDADSRQREEGEVSSQQPAAAIAVPPPLPPHAESPAK